MSPACPRVSSSDPNTCDCGIAEEGSIVAWLFGFVQSGVRDGPKTLAPGYVFRLYSTTTEGSGGNTDVSSSAHRHC